MMRAPDAISRARWYMERTYGPLPRDDNEAQDRWHERFGMLLDFLIDDDMRIERDWALLRRCRTYLRLVTEHNDLPEATLLLADLTAAGVEE